MSPDPKANPEAQWFGDRPVAAGEKTPLVAGVFRSVATRYDLMNDLMSLGTHRVWKDRFVRRVAPRKGESILDVAGGTGDIAQRLARTPGRPRVTVCDLTQGMVEVGRDRAIDRGHLSVGWSVGNAQALPFRDGAFDAYTIAFGLRNVAEIDTALAEAFRVLRYGGRFFCLEFSRVRAPAFAAIYDLYSRATIPALGGFVGGDRASYEYLVESIRRFPAQEALAGRITAAGFEQVKVEDMSGGIVAIHSGRKL